MHLYRYKATTFIGIKPKSAKVNPYTICTV